MNIEIKDFNKVLDVLPAIEGEGVYSLVISFTDGDVMSYGYINRCDIISDYKNIMRKLEEY